MYIKTLLLDPENFFFSWQEIKKSLSHALKYLFLKFSQNKSKIILKLILHNLEFFKFSNHYF